MWNVDYHRIVIRINRPNQKEKENLWAKKQQWSRKESVVETTRKKTPDRSSKSKGNQLPAGLEEKYKGDRCSTWAATQSESFR